MDPYEIDVVSQQTQFPVPTDRLAFAVRRTLETERVRRAVISVTIVDNTTIHKLNREHLDHDDPTDVISFQLDFEAGSQAPATSPLRADGASIEGEVVASVEMAAQIAPQHGWSPDDELTLYVIHGLLHICGYDDLTESEATLMRQRERAALESCRTIVPIVPEPP